MTLNRRAFLASLAAGSAAALARRTVLAQGNPDVVVIGAGVAGLCAAKAVLAAKKTVTVLEARRRIGGRAYTESVTFGAPFDHGCAWLHSADINPVTKIAQSLGFETYDEGQRPIWLYYDGKEASAADYAAFEEASVRVRDAFDGPGDEGRDISAAQMFQPKTRAERFAVARMAEWEAGVDWSQVSTMDVYSQEATGVEWMVPRGLGTVVANYGKDVPVVLDAEVKTVRWGGRNGVAVEGAFGKVEARACVVTLPTDVVSQGAVRFDPPLPPEKMRAFEDLPLGGLEKITLQFRRNPFGDANGNTVYLQNADGPIMDCLLRPFGLDLVTCFTGGGEADRLRAAGEKAAVDWALDELAKTFGTGLKAEFIKGHMTGWRNDPFSRGAYSASKPGRNRSRAVLAEPVEERLFFAGEAADPKYSTGVHGAHDTGWRAGRAAAESG